MVLNKYKTELSIFLTISIIYSFFTFVKISHSPLQNLIAGGAADYYWQIANNLATQARFSLDGSSPTALRMPGYPLFLALPFKMFHNWWIIIFLQNIISGLSAVLLYLIAKKWLPSNWAIATAILWALEPYSIDISSQFLTETLYTFILLLSIFIFIEYKNKLKEYLFISIVALALAILVYIRPISIFLPLIFALAIGYPSYKIKAKQMLFLFVIFFLLLFPWLLRNRLVFNSWQLSSDNTSSLYVTALLFQAEKEGSRDIDREQPQKSEFSTWLASDDLSTAKPQLKATVKIIASDPISFTGFYLKNLAIGVTGSSWWGSTRNLIKGTTGETNHYKEVVSAISRFDLNEIAHFSPKKVGALALMTTGVVFWSWLIILAIIGAFLLFKRANSEQRPVVVLLISTTAYLILIGNMAMGDMIRYRFPASPLIILFAIYTFFSLVRKNKNV